MGNGPQLGETCRIEWVGISFGSAARCRKVNQAARIRMSSQLISRCESQGIRLTGQRRAVVKALEESTDHPNVEDLHERALKLDPQISIATVYRTVKLLEEIGMVERHEFGGGRARYEDADREHHDHLIDINSGQVIEFIDPEIEALQQAIATRLGYRLKGHRMELYGVPVRKDGGD